MAVVTPQQHRLSVGMLRLFRTYGTGGASWTGKRPAGDGISADVTTSTLAARTIYFVPAKLEQFQAAFPGVEVFTAPYFGFARAGVDLRAGDTYTDGMLAYLITGTPATEHGFVLAPATPCAVPSDLVVVGGSSSVAAVYTRLATSIFPVLSQFAVGGPSFTGARPSGDGISADVSTSALAARTIYFVPAKLEQFQATFPGVQVFTTPYFGFARAGVDLRVGDTYTDGTFAYLITGVPATEYGFVLAPAVPCAVITVTGGGYRSPLWILGMAA